MLDFAAAKRRREQREEQWRRRRRHERRSFFRAEASVEPGLRARDTILLAQQRCEHPHAGTLCAGHISYDGEHVAREDIRRRVEGGAGGARPDVLLKAMGCANWREERVEGDFSFGVVRLVG